MPTMPKSKELSRTTKKNIHKKANKRAEREKAKFALKELYHSQTTYKEKAPERHVQDPVINKNMPPTFATTSININSQIPKQNNTESNEGGSSKGVVVKQMKTLNINPYAENIKKTITLRQSKKSQFSKGKKSRMKLSRQLALAFNKMPCLSKGNNSQNKVNNSINAVQDKNNLVHCTNESDLITLETLFFNKDINSSNDNTVISLIDEDDEEDLLRIPLPIPINVKEESHNLKEKNNKSRTQEVYPIIIIDDDDMITETTNNLNFNEKSRSSEIKINFHQNAIICDIPSSKKQSNIITQTQPRTLMAMSLNKVLNSTNNNETLNSVIDIDDEEELSRIPLPISIDNDDKNEIKWRASEPKPIVNIDIEAKLLISDENDGSSDIKEKETSRHSKPNINNARDLPKGPLKRSDYYVMIYRADHIPMDESWEFIIRKKLYDIINDALDANVDSRRLSFEQLNIVTGGFFRAEPINRESYDWILSCQLGDYNGIRLKISKEYKGRAVVYLPYSGPHDPFKILKGQNYHKKKVRTDEWSLLFRDCDPTGQRLLCRVPDSVVMTQKYVWLNFLLRQVKVSFFRIR